MTDNKFVVFEGLDGVGKSTQAQLLAERRGAFYTKQPSEEALTKPFRDLLLDPSSEISNYLETLIFTVDRTLHVERVLSPALESGKDVVCDRYVGSFLAYQGYGRGEDIELLRELSRRATDGLEPDLVILLWDESPARHIEEKDRIESEGLEFHNRVKEGYMKLLEANPKIWSLVKVDGSKEAISEKINTLVGEKLGW